MTDLFCQVASGEVAVAEVYRDANVVAFLDHRPLFKGHVLVIPTTHADELTDLPAGLIGPVFATAQRVASALGEAFGAEGSFVAVNNRISQSVPHLHVHVVPRSAGDGLRGFFWPRQRYAEGEAEEYASRLRRVLDAPPGGAAQPAQS